MSAVVTTGSAPSRVSSPFSVRGRAFRMFVLLVAFMLIVATICLVYSVRLIGDPFAGFLFYAFPAVGSFGDFQWPGFQAGVRYQDIIEEVAGQKVSTSRDVQQIVASTPVGTSIAYVLRRHGEALPIKVPVSRFTLTDFVKLFGPTFLSGVFFG